MGDGWMMDGWWMDDGGGDGWMVGEVWMSDGGSRSCGWMVGGRTEDGCMVDGC